MSSKFPIKTKIAGLVITTFLLIILSLSLYLFVVIRNNERQIINRSFRTLVQIGENIKDKNTTYVKIVANNTKIIQNSTSGIKTKEKKIEEEEIKRLIKNDIILYRVNPELYPYKRDSIFINPEDSVKEVTKEEFFNSLVRKDVFDAFIIRTGDTVVFNSQNLDIKLNPVNKKDSAAWQAGNVDLVTIGAIDYQRFSLPLKMDEEDWWYIDGMIENANFQSEKKSLGTWFVIIMFILFIFIVLSFPVLRLFLMSPVEQMHRSNLFLAGTSVVLGSSLITILLISMLSNSEIQSIRKQRLKTLADTVHKEFVNELNSIYEQMKYYDSLDSVYFNNDILLADSIIRKKDSLVYLPQKYTNYKTMFWMDGQGQQLQEFKMRQSPENLINLSYRDYFKNKDGWQLPGCNNTNSHCRFMIESIYSNTSGDALAAVSTRSTGKKRFFNETVSNDTLYQPASMAMTAPMYSVMDPVLPKGYSFSIIDQEGKVWFHSNKHRNLQENLLAECSHNSKLESAIFSRTPESIRLSYQNKDYRVYILPIRNIPLFIVAMEESSLINSYNSTIVTLSFLFVFAFLLLIGIQAFILKITDSEETKLKRKKYTLDWLLPQKTNTEKYSSLFIGHLLVLISLIFLFVFTDETEIFLFDAFFLFLYVQLFITEKARHQLKIGPRKIKTDNLPFFGKIKIDGFSVIVGLFILIINIFHAKISEKYLVFFLFQGWILFLLIIPWPVIFNNLEKKEKESEKTTQPKKSHFFLSFQLFIITWLLLISFFPTIVFFQNALLIERKINRKYQQLHLVREFQNRNNEIDSYFAKHDINDTENHFYRNQRKNKGIYTKFIGVTIREANDSCAASTKMPDNYSDSLLLNMRPLYTADIVENRKLIFNTGTDFNWKRIEADSAVPPAEYDSLLLRFNSTEIQAKDSLISKPHLISASLKKETILGGYRIFTLLFWVLLLFFILLIYNLLENVLKRIFPFTDKTGAMKMPFGELLTTISNTRDWPAFTFAVNLSGKDSNSRKTEAKELGFKCFKVSCDNYVPDEFSKEDKVVILNFGFILRSVELFDKCINLLEDLINKKVQKIVISSYVSPKQIQVFYKDHSKKITSKFERKKITANLNRIKQLLTEFSVINCALQPAVLKQAEDKRIPEIIYRELENDVFLASLKPLVLNYYENNKSVDEEDLIIYIQNLASNYYEKIWNSCNIEEKILLYDLAEDSLVNIKNNDAFAPLRNLQEKGIVVCNDKFTVMNESFRNYVLSNIEKTELENTEIMKKRKSAWNSFRIPLILFASGIVIFLFATQQALVSNLYTLLIAVGTIAGVFIKVSGMFSSKSKLPAGVKSE
jgi:hypothetical protein